MDIYKFYKIDGDKILLKDSNESVIELPNSEEYLKMFASDICEVQSTESSSLIGKSLPVAQELPEKVSWNDASTRGLIYLYKDNEKIFNDKTTRNDEVWKEISNSLSANGFTFTSKQCQNKFKHLKKLYMKCKDNMGSKGTGNSTFGFKYLQEMDEIFATKPNITPVATASSSAGSKINSDVLSQSFKEGCKRKADVDESTNKQKKKPSAVIVELLQKNEENREKRHQDFLAAQREATQTYEKIMNKLIDKI